VGEPALWAASHSGVSRLTRDGARGHSGRGLGRGRPATRDPSLLATPACDCIPYEERKQEHATRCNDHEDPENGAGNRGHSVDLYEHAACQLQSGLPQKICPQGTRIALSYLSPRGTTECTASSHCAARLCFSVDSLPTHDVERERCSRRAPSRAPASAGRTRAKRVPEGLVRRASLRPSEVRTRGTAPSRVAHPERSAEPGAARPPSEATGCLQGVETAPDAAAVPTA
jgi:hypothetical protein